MKYEDRAFARSFLCHIASRENFKRVIITVISEKKRFLY